MKRTYVLLLAALFASCNQATKEDHAKKDGTVTDPHSFAQPQLALVKHLDLNVKVQFETQLITGKASWTIENPGKTNEIIFDSQGLDISKVTLGADEKPTTFSFTEEKKNVGKGLKVKIDTATKQVNIYYSSAKNAGALQWLNPQQTAGKKQPFLFTQSEAILARTWIPCQDSPGIRFTYNAQVEVPKNLMAVMSAENAQQKNTTGIYTFKQPKAIPSYLMALAVGDLAFKSVDGRTGVYAEPVTLEKAAYEFADMGKMVTAAEKLYGPYQWGRYDVLVLPPSFPFGGMENPMLTFATPTVIAGDRSLVSLIAHELAHSWSGNLVTNATWNDFWLNEGFTVYFERRIVEAVYGKDEAKMQELLGSQDLHALVKELGEKSDATKLKLHLNDQNPDDGMNDIAYEKGYAFLRVVEEAVGRDKLDAFLKGWFSEHAFHSVTTEDFVQYLQAKLIKGDKELEKKINFNAWIYEPGIPANATKVGAPKFDALDKLLQNPATSLTAKLNSTNEKLYFIRHLPENISIKDMEALDQQFKFTVSGNSEVQCVWYLLAVRKQYKPAYPAIEQFLTEVGRRKFLLPLYKEMIKTPEGKKWAKQIYAKARPNYHPVAYATIDELLAK